MDEPVELSEYLRDVTYPATREELLRAAQDAGASPEVLRHLSNIETGPYGDEDAVSAAVTYLGETTTRYGHVTVYDQ